MSLDLDCLEAFIAFAEHKNFTRAAQACALSQPALHARIRRLTESLGTPLYIRDGRQLVLTSAGEKVEAFARELKTKSDAFLDELVDTRRHRPPVLSAGEGAYLYLLGPALKRYTKRGRTIELRCGDGPQVESHIARGEADIGVLSLDHPPASRLTGEVLEEVAQVIALPQNHPLTDREQIRPRDLAGVRLVVPPSGRPLRRQLDNLLDGVTCDIAVEASGWPLTLQLVALGAGVAIINDFCTLPKGVTTRPFVGLPVRRYWAVHRADVTLLPEVRRLWNALTA